MQTIESTETKSITKSRYRGEPVTSNYKYYERENRYNSSGASPVVIEVRNNYRKWKTFLKTLFLIFTDIAVLFARTHHGANFPYMVSLILILGFIV